MGAKVTIVEAKHPEDYAMATALFREYAETIAIDLSFQGFDEEIMDIQKQYSRPHGTLLMVYRAGKPMGCAGIRRLEGSICELKRMYVKGALRGQGIGELLLHKSIALANELHYKKIRLDTLGSMKAAIRLYTKAGFKEIAPYRFNPLPGTKYFELTLHNG